MFFAYLVTSLPGCQQLYQNIYFAFFVLYAVARNIWKSRPIPVEKGLKITTCWVFFEKFSHLSVLWMVLNESSCNFCFLIATPSHIYSEMSLILIYYSKMFSFNQNQLVLFSHTQLWLDQSDSKILETPITQEKFKYSNFSLHMDTNQEDTNHGDAFLLIIYIIIAIIIIITLVFYWTSVKRHINDKTNLKSQSLRLDLFAPN